MQKSKKVENGKLIKIDGKLGEKFEDIKVHGDFFIEPADKLKQIRDIIEGLEKDFDRERVLTQLGDIDAKFIGFSAEDIIDVLEEFKGDEK